MNPTFSPMAGLGGGGGATGAGGRGDSLISRVSAADGAATTCSEGGATEGGCGVSTGGKGGGGSGGAETIRTGSWGRGGSVTATGLAPPSFSSRYSAVILSSELDGTLAPVMPSSLALARTSLLSIPSFFAMS